MLGVYNNMVLGLGLSALVALGIDWLAVAGSEAEGGTRIGGVPLRISGCLYHAPDVVGGPAAPRVHLLLHVPHGSDDRRERADDVLRIRRGDRGVAFDDPRQLHGRERRTGVLHHRRLVRRTEPVGLHNLPQPVRNRLVLDDGRHRVDHSHCRKYFLASSALQFAIAALGVLIFAGLTAYDTQKLKEMYVSGSHDTEAAGKLSIFGALTLYRDFINMFQFLLALSGKRN